MMRRVMHATKLFVAVQYRSDFVTVYVAVTLFTVALLTVFAPDTWKTVLVPALLLGEYGTMGVYMVAALSYLARNEGSTLALAVTPLARAERVVATVLAPALIAVPAGAVLFGAVVGVDARVALLLPPLLATTILAGSVGLLLASRYTEFTRFILGSIPVVSLFSLPLLSYFELVPRYTFAWLPWDAALFSFSNLTRPQPELWIYALLTVQLFVFAGLALWWASKSERTPI